MKRVARRVGVGHGRGMERTVTVAPGVELWVEERGDPEAPAVLLVMGAASSGLVRRL